MQDTASGGISTSGTAISRTSIDRNAREGLHMPTKKQNEDALRQQFETTLPELLEKQEEVLREHFEETTLPILLEEAETYLREQFEANLEEQLDEIDA